MLSSLNGCCLYSHLCSVEITAHCLYDTVLFVQSEYQHRHLILKAHDRCGQIYCHKLLIDDFLAKGKALDGLTTLIQDSGAELVGAGIVIEKGFQDGGKRIRDKGIRVESLAIVDSMNAETGEIVFRNEDK